METKEQKKENEYVLVEVPTGSALAIQKPDGELISTELALVEILNKLEKIEKAVA